MKRKCTYIVEGILEKPPIMQCEIYKGQAWFYCVYCRLLHGHGAPERIEHRAAHCIVASPLRKTGYYIVAHEDPHFIARIPRGVRPVDIDRYNRLRKEWLQKNS
jgi:hypothetical protein